MSRFLFPMLILMAAWTSAAAEDVGPWSELERHADVVTAVRAEDNNVWIKLASGHLSDTIRVRISDRNGDFYRSWFTGDVDLVSTGFRGNDVWSDRVQTQAKYIEYWLGDTKVLHLERRD